jgi:drug/metabolite transporter (DMT)-like permease
MYVVSKDTFARVPPLTLFAIRLALGGGALAVLLARRERLRLPRDPLIGVGALALGATLVTQSVGTHLATGTEAALYTTITPLFLVPLAWLGLRERPRPATLLGIGAGFLGLLLAVDAGVGVERSVWGPVFLVLSALGWAGYTVATAPAARRDGPLAAVTWSTLGALPLLALASLTEIERWNADAFTHAPTLLALAYLGFGATAAAWYLWGKGVSGLPAAVAGAFFFAQPVVGGVLGWLLLDERPTLRFVAGGALIAAGVLLALRATRTTPDVPAPIHEEV